MGEVRRTRKNGGEEPQDATPIPSLGVVGKMVSPGALAGRGSAAKPAAVEGSNTGSPRSSLNADAILKQVPVDKSALIRQVGMFDASRGRARRVLGMIFAAVLLAALGTVVAYPGEREYLLALIRNTWARVSLNDSTAHRRGTSIVVMRDPEEPTEVAPARVRGCKELAAAAAGSASSLGFRDAVTLADCLLVLDDPAGAEAVLHPLLPKLTAGPDSSLEGANLGDAFLTAIAAYLRQGKAREAGELCRNRCLYWTQSTACVGKVMVVADRHQVQSGHDGLDRMFAGRPALTPKATARLWLAGAQIAATEGRSAVADQRYVLALAAAPKTAAVLRKQIFEAQILDLYQRGERDKVRQVATRAGADLASLPAGARVKIQTLEGLATAPNRAKAIQAMMTREELVFKLRGDVELLEVLGPEAMRFGLEGDYIRLLHQSGEVYTQSYRAPSSIQRRLAAWEIRALLSKRDFETATTKLASYEKTHGRDPFVNHMRGVAYHWTSAHVRYQTMAVREFQLAALQRQSWETLYGLGIAMIGAGRQDQATEVIRDLERIIASADQKYWVDMLKVEYYLARKNFDGAQKTLAAWRQSKPDWVMPRRLEARMEELQGRKDKARRLLDDLDEATRGRRFEATIEGFQSPMGALALARRPPAGSPEKAEKKAGAP